MEEIKNEIIEFIQDEFKKYKYFGVIIGISGGIDSTVTAKLLVEALGKKRVFGLLMPERDSYKDTLKDSKMVCEHLGIKYKVIDLSPVLR
ncbi:MAG: NAD(+) synthase, partial [Bacillota bacterium]|nr:NAD(+) synthase [Bacillota bacterium]